MYSTDESGYCIENRWTKGKSRSWENIKDVIAVIGGWVAWARKVAVEEMRKGWILVIFCKGSQHNMLMNLMWCMRQREESKISAWFGGSAPGRVKLRRGWI